MTIDELKKKIKGITHWLDFDIDIPTLYEFVFNLKIGQVYLEVGTAFGNSAITAALSASNGVEIHTIDNGQSYIGKQIKNIEVYEKEVYDEFLRMNVKDKITFHCGNSWDIPWSKDIHLLFIDGDHSSRSIKEDIEKWVPHVIEGGYVLFHDYDFHGTPEVKPTVDSSLSEFHLEKIKQKGTILITQKKERSLKDCTILIVDYRERTLKKRRTIAEDCIKGIRQFYPDIPISIITDEISNFNKYPFKNTISCFQSREIDLLPQWHGHGFGLDLGFRKIVSGYIIVLDHNMIMKNPGVLEKLIEYSKNTHACGGEQQNKTAGIVGKGYVHPMLAIYDPRPIKRYNLSFLQLILRLQETTLVFATGQFLSYRLEEEDFKVNLLSFSQFWPYCDHIKS